MGNEELIKLCTEKAQKWLTPAYDVETQAEVKRMIENEDKTDLIEAFYKDLEFGTGGLRGIMGVGSNRMNIYTVGAATQGLSNYLNKCFAGKKDISVVVGHDCRNNSRLFAEISANIFSANGIKVYLFDDMRPTPEMSCHLLSATLAARAVSSLLLHTILRNTTATRHTGMMAHRYLLHTTRVSSTK